MTKEQKALPAIIRLRAERVLKRGLKAVYRVDENNANLLRAVGHDDSIAYVDLATNREVKHAELKVTLVDDSSQDDQSTADKKDNTKMISREKATGKKTASNKRKEAPVTKKKATKK